MDKLSELIAGSRADMNRRMQIVSAFDLRMLVNIQKPAIDVLPILQDESTVNLIAEIKRRSPSKGKIADILDPVELAKEYERAGASVISVLTEEHQFGGSLSDLREVKDGVSIPILRKDFIVDEYQVLEARANGADCILLIMAAFDGINNGGFTNLQHLLNYTHELGMRALVECHSPEEVKLAKALDVKIIGINARDLKTFNVDTSLFSECVKDLPPDTVKVGESGVFTTQDFLKYVKSGADAVLCGEGLLKSADKRATIEQFLTSGKQYRSGESLASIVGPYFGEYGGRFVPEALIGALDEFEQAYNDARADHYFKMEYLGLLEEYVGRPSVLTEVPRFASEVGNSVSREMNGLGVHPRIFLKREDLNHTGAHKINNALGQALLAKRMGKKRVIAETGAGQHGVATATVCALLGLECVIYMGKVDAKRQALNVARMQLLGAKVVQVENGDAILKDAINEALRDWVTNAETTHYLLGTVAGPHPFPTIVRDFQKIIGEEAREQLSNRLGASENKEILPDAVVACVGGGSNALGIFNAFLDSKEVALFGIEAGGAGLESGRHATRFAADVQGAKNTGSIGVFQGAKSYVLQDEDGQTLSTHSISAGLDYASIGPEHPWLKDIGRVNYSSATDDEAMQAFATLSRTEGIIPAIESSHALAGAHKACLHIAKGGNLKPVILINLSGRGDKDVVTAGRYFHLFDGDDSQNQPSEEEV